MNMSFVTKRLSDLLERTQGMASESMSLSVGTITYQWCDLGKISKKLHIRLLICKMKSGNIYIAGLL